MSDKRFEIIDKNEEPSFLHDNTGEYENIPIENALEFLLNKANESDKVDYNLVAVHDYLLGIERKLVLVEKLIDELDSVSRRYWKENDRDLRNRRNRQFLMSGKHTVDHNINDIWKNINWIRNELGYNKDLHSNCSEGMDDECS